MVGPWINGETKTLWPQLPYVDTEDRFFAPHYPALSGTGLCPGQVPREAGLTRRDLWGCGCHAATTGRSDC